MKSIGGCIALRLKGAVVSPSPLQVFPPLVTVKITCIIGTYVRVLFLSVLRTLTFNVNFRQLAVNASQCRVPEARERKWSLILRAKARCGMQAFHLGQSMKRTSMYAL